MLPELTLTNEKQLLRDREALQKAYLDARTEERRLGKEYVNLMIALDEFDPLVDQADAALIAARARTASLGHDLMLLDERIVRVRLGEA